MPYSNKPESVERVIPILDVLLTADRDVVLPSTNPHRLTYWLYNAIATAGTLEAFHKYAGLGGKFKFRARPGQVMCELRTTVAIFELPIGVTKDGLIALATNHNEDIDSVTGIIGLLASSKVPSQAYFPNAVLSQEDLALLHRWTSANAYHIINHEEDGVTVTKEETELEWKP